MYNKRIKFDGDIIITDPCYIINKKNDDRFDENGNCNSPSWWDFISKTTKTLVDDGNGGSWIRYNIPKPQDYPDCRIKTLEDCRSESEKILLKISDTIMFSPTLQAEWDAYHKADEEYRSVPHDDWERCDCGDDMSVLGLKTYLTADTKYGDWSCTVFETDTKKVLGQFCADSSNVGVFLLEEVLAYNPDFNCHIDIPWTTTLIKDFHGYVSIKYDKDDRGEKCVFVVGHGNINFISKQTGF